MNADGVKVVKGGTRRMRLHAFLFDEQSPKINGHVDVV